jgi:hypothetical protein
MRSTLDFTFKLESFKELSISQGAESEALAYICLRREDDGRLVHGVGLAGNIDQAGFKAMLSCCNQLSLT